MNRHCLSCQKPLENDTRYHPKCLKNLFGRPRVPSILFGIADVPNQVIKTGARMSISGMQMKLSVRINPDTWTMETVAEGGTHILKPNPTQFPGLPQNENLCMNMAAELNLPVPPHGLFPMSDGSLCYIIKRFDRLDGGTKLLNETIFQIIGVEDKYRGSLEQVGKIIRKHAANIGLDSIDFFERTLFCFLIGNGDMHLKNWALLTGKDGPISLAPCYDFVSSKIYFPDEEDSALTINGKRSKLLTGDFEFLASGLKIDLRAMSGSFRKLLNAKNKLLEICGSSDRTVAMYQKLSDVIASRYDQL